MTKEEEIELAYQQLAQSKEITPDKSDYWEDYEEAEWQQYEQEQEKIWAEQDAIDAEKEKEVKPAPDKYIIIERKPPLWDVSGDDSSLNPAFW